MKEQLFLIFSLLTTISLSAAQIYDAHEAKSLLGYDPHITLLQDNNSGVVKSPRKNVYFHGFGGNKDAASEVRHYYGSARLAGDVITFDFADANNDGMDTSKSSLGQWNDIKAALYVLKKLHDAGETEVGITAHSRGGATAINLVAALVDQAGDYEARLEELGIDAATRNALIEMLQNGHIVLECPLIDVRSVIQNQIAQTSSSIFGRWFASSSVADASTYSSATSVDYVVPVMLKQYRPWAEQARRSAAAWNNARIPTIVHFQEHDEVLGNKSDNEFYATLVDTNGLDFTYFHKGNDGGHNSSFKSFARARNRFLKNHGGSYTVLEQ